ncbi:sugar transferase [Gymnodinialimonas hymeniacidonis]|uniref:sugar transferase n=1 Tax=Gymnodinialimonas hymeniacidonis TaxID=3126508 RepID=UPI0034C62C33
MTLVPDFDRHTVVRHPSSRTLRTGGSPLFWRCKAVADILGAVMMLPLVAVLAGLLLLLNPVFNPGPLLFQQARMGRNGQIFHAIKFRTMRAIGPQRGPLDPVEYARVSRLGRLLRRTGLDELPQAINILRGEMSLIGPRPDCAVHAQTYLQDVPEYRARLTVKPGISGYAQITLGYAVGIEATRAKVRADLDYIARANFALDLWITWRTILSILLARGD